MPNLTDNNNADGTAFYDDTSLEEVAFPEGLMEQLGDLDIHMQEALDFLCSPDPINSPLGNLSQFSSTTAPSNQVQVREDSETYRAAREEMLALTLTESLSDQNQYMTDLFAIAERYRTAPLANPAAAEEPSSSAPGL
jgi:hypothetical protein